MTRRTPGMGRRQFLKVGAAGAVAGAAAWRGGLPFAAAAPRPAMRPRRGPIVSPGLVQAGPELSLPPGFTYKTLAPFGSAMTDGFITPPIHDGMGVFDNPGGGYRIVRNHELGDSNDIGPGSVLADPRTAYDHKAPGGTVTLVVDDQANLIEHFISMNGTDSNCSGAPTPWGTWLSCEETTVGRGGGWGKPHGYIFEVDAFADAPVRTEPIKEMGRFVHEAAAVDPLTSVVYMTEDNNPDGFYRYVPDVPGKLAKGGLLQQLRVKGHAGYNTVVGQTVGEVLPVEWYTHRDPDPAAAEDDARTIFRVGRQHGCARFMSGEGCTWRGNSVVFDCSDGGDYGRGQIWQYTPTKRRGKANEEGELTLLFESTDKAVMDYPDNMCTSPNGQAIVMAEDGDDKTNRLLALLPDNSIIPIADNLVKVRAQLIDASGKLYDPYVPDDDFGPADGLGRSEFAGPRFSPDGKWLFVNIQVPGITCAIKGNWASLGL